MVGRDKSRLSAVLRTGQRGGRKGEGRVGRDRLSAVLFSFSSCNDVFNHHGIKMISALSGVLQSHDIKFSVNANS